MSSFLWPSVFVKAALDLYIVRRKVVKIESCSTFGDLLEKSAGKEVEGQIVDKISTCKNEKFVDPVHEVPLDAPVVLCEQYGINICYHLTSRHTNAASSARGRNLFEVLMSSARERVQPKKCKGRNYIKNNTLPIM